MFLKRGPEGIRTLDLRFRKPVPPPFPCSDSRVFSGLQSPHSRPGPQFGHEYAPQNAPLHFVFNDSLLRFKEGFRQCFDLRTWRSSNSSDGLPSGRRWTHNSHALAAGFRVHAGSKGVPLIWGFSGHREDRRPSRSRECLTPAQEAQLTPSKLRYLPQTLLRQGVSIRQLLAGRAIANYCFPLWAIRRR
jgi:hypothetical protein